MFDAKIYILTMDGPDDVRGLERLIDSGEIDVGDIKGVMVMPEGDGFARAFTTMAFTTMLGRKMKLDPKEVNRRIPIQGITGLAGFMVPHAAVMVRREVPGAPKGRGKRLVVAGACTPDLLPEEVGTMSQMRGVRDIVRSLMKEAAIKDPADVHMVFVKSPWPDEHQRAAARSRGKRVVTDNHPLMGNLTRAASALGVAVALGEVSEDGLTEASFLQNQDRVFSQIAHCSSGAERTSNAVILLGNSEASLSDYFIGHGMLKDALDPTGVKDILRSMGFSFACCPSRDDLARIAYAFLKPKGRELPTIRGHRHTMNSDPALGMHGWNIEKTPSHAVVASVLGTPLIEVASGPEHQGPPGVPVLAVVARA